MADKITTSAPVGVEGFDAGLVADMLSNYQRRVAAESGESARTKIIQQQIDALRALAQQPAAVDGTLRVVGRVVRHLSPGQPEGKSVIWNDLPEAGTTLYALAAQPQGGAK